MRSSAAANNFRHCEEPLRRSNPDYRGGETLDCFATLAMTECVATPRPNLTPTPASGTARCSSRPRCSRRTIVPLRCGAWYRAGPAP
ncbi:hypothetical protein EAS61_00150 [Bradyrhizobium zhanjiangense]|uniref:Uncharacterized protein n=1 Tax=Bradyrhizobium zhanjiangense TaxID=1325107 RepID=A0A4Q0QZ83_9BRAD|nr:hypothetical protein EAS61_00150 [Bradyrhizobium zhanjiangense]